MIDARTLSEFRLLLAAYLDQSRDDGSDHLVDPLRNSIVDFVRRNANCHAELEQALAYLLVDAESGLEELLGSLRNELSTRELHDALKDYGRRFPRLQREGYVAHLLNATDGGTAETDH